MRERSIENRLVSTVGIGMSVGDLPNSMINESPSYSSDTSPCDVSPYKEDNIPKEVLIKPLGSGYYVKVGCQEVAVESTEKLITMLNSYLSNPNDFERKYYSKDVRNRLDNI